MTPVEKVNRAEQFCRDLQDEYNPMIVQSRIEAMAKGLGVNPFLIAFMYWSLKDKGKIQSMFGAPTKIRFSTR